MWRHCARSAGKGSATDSPDVVQRIVLRAMWAVVQQVHTLMTAERTGGWLGGRAGGAGVHVHVHVHAMGGGQPQLCM